MALPNRVLPGFSATLYAQSGANPTPLTVTELGTWTDVNAIAVDNNIIPVEAIPAFGQDDAVANFNVAGSRQSDKIPTQAAPTSMTITAAWNPADTQLLQMRADAYNGTIDRTFVVLATDGQGDYVAYAFNGRVGQWDVDTNPTAEAKCSFTVHPRGNQYGWSNNP
jgi:hypothetical protein